MDGRVGVDGLMLKADFGVFGWMGKRDTDSGSWIILLGRGAWSDCTKAFAWRLPSKESGKESGLPNSYH